MSAVDHTSPTEDPDKPAPTADRPAVPVQRPAIIDGAPRIDRPRHAASEPGSLPAADVGGPPSGQPERAGTTDREVDADAPQTPGRTVTSETELETLNGADRQAVAAYEQQLREVGKSRPAEQTGPEYDYQRQWCGNTEYDVSPDNAASETWADGLNHELGYAQDAKHVGNEARSWFIPDTLPPPMRHAAELDIDRRLAKYQDAINDPASPIGGIEIITNSHAAAQYISGRMNALGVHGTVRIEQAGDHREQ